MEERERRLPLIFEESESCNGLLLAVGVTGDERERGAPSRKRKENDSKEERGRPELMTMIVLPEMEKKMQKRWRTCSVVSLSV